jgi:ribonuclease P/MRP protein subunit RPP40
VSLTAVACKVMESIVGDHTVDHMKQNKLFSNSQHSFIGGRSCMSQLISVLEEWTQTLDEGGKIDAIYMDFMKAFDTVPHRRLLVKMQSYGIHGEVLTWVEAFLSGRQQRVVVNGAMSTWANVTSGIPQRSVLGPILFVIFINDLPDMVPCTARLFADDTKAYKAISSINDCVELQRDLDEMQKWATEWQMRFHLDKCKVLRIGRGHPDFQYTMCKQGEPPHTLEESSVEKDLGVFVDNQLSFSKHIQEAISKTNRLLGVIRRTYKFLDEVSWNLLYKGLVRPKLEYGVTVWSPRLQRDIDGIENIQRRATKMIPGFKDLSYEERLQRLRLPTLVYRRLRGDMIEVFKYMNNYYDVQVDGIFKRAISTRTRGHSKKIFKQSSNRPLRSHFFSQRVVDRWNNLPETVVEAPSLNAFKNRLDSHWVS